MTDAIPADLANARGHSEHWRSRQIAGGAHYASVELNLAADVDGGGGRREGD
jgi:hypothetical protein